jgi:hypothetical protein
VRRLVVLADVRLDLDDPADPTGLARAVGRRLANQVGAEQRARGVEGGSGEQLAPQRRATTDGAGTQRRATPASAVRNAS